MRSIVFITLCACTQKQQVRPVEQDTSGAFTIADSGLEVRVSIPQGQAGLFPITISRTEGLTQNDIAITLIDPPAGISGSGGIPAAESSTKLLIDVALSVPVVDYSLTAKLSDGISQKLLPFTLSVLTEGSINPSAAGIIDFASAIPERTMGQDGQVAVDVGIIRSGIATGEVTLEVQDLPAGIVADLPAPFTRDFGTILLRDDGTAAVGGSTVKILAKHAGVGTAQTTFTLTVTPENHIHVTVLDAGGAPLPAAEVWIDGLGNTADDSGQLDIIQPGRARGSAYTIAILSPVLSSSHAISLYQGITSTHPKLRSVLANSNGASAEPPHATNVFQGALKYETVEAGNPTRTAAFGPSGSSGLTGVSGRFIEVFTASSVALPPEKVGLKSPETQHYCSYLNACTPSQTDDSFPPPFLPRTRTIVPSLFSSMVSVDKTLPSFDVVYELLATEFTARDGSQTGSQKGGIGWVPKKYWMHGTCALNGVPVTNAALKFLYTWGSCGGGPDCYQCNGSVDGFPVDAPIEVTQTQSMLVTPPLGYTLTNKQLWLFSETRGWEYKIAEDCYEAGGAGGCSTTTLSQPNYKVPNLPGIAAAIKTTVERADGAKTTSVARLGSVSGIDPPQAPALLTPADGASGVALGQSFSFEPTSDGPKVVAILGGGLYIICHVAGSECVLPDWLANVSSDYQWPSAANMFWVMANLPLASMDDLVTGTLNSFFTLQGGSDIHDLESHSVTSEQRSFTTP